MINIEANLNRVKNEIAQAAQVSGRNVTDIELVAVTKTHPAEVVRKAVDAGHLVFGESKVQEARVKIPLLPSNRSPSEEQNPSCASFVRNDT